MANVNVAPEQTETSGFDQPGRLADPCAMVIFGGTGDLTKRKLIPALYNLSREGLLPEGFAVVGIGRTPLSTEEFRDKIDEDIKHFATIEIEAGRWKDLLSRLYYLSGDLQNPETYQHLGQLLAQIDKDHATRGNYFYYLATAPTFFGEVIRQLGAAGLAAEGRGHWRRVIIEKPFGVDLESARALNHEISQVLQENQIYRIDHYLGKETVQNILVFRFSNGIFEPIWNRRYIDHVQITVSETVGVETRGGYYDQSGALRDMVPNHIFQLIMLTAMEPPISFEADAVRDEQAKILRAIPPLNPEDVLNRSVRGQYGEGVIEGERVPAYRTEPHVRPDSATETFVALRLSIDNWRWAEVPFYLRTGKRLPSRVTEVAIRFKHAPFILFRKTPVERLDPKRTGDPYSTRRRHLSAFRRQDPGTVGAARCGEDEFCLHRLFWHHAYHGLRAPALRLHGGRRHPVSACRHGGGGMERGGAYSRCVEGLAAAQFPQLRVRHLGSQGIE